MNANLIFKWLRVPKYRPGPGTGSKESGLRFLPVKIVKEKLVTRPIPASENHIEVDLAGVGTGCGSAAAMTPKRSRG